MTSMDGGWPGERSPSGSGVDGLEFLAVPGGEQLSVAGQTCGHALEQPDLRLPVHRRTPAAEGRGDGCSGVSPDTGTIEHRNGRISGTDADGTEAVVRRAAGCQQQALEERYGACTVRAWSRPRSI